MEEERILGVVYGAGAAFGRLPLAPSLYDLIFTDRRLVGVVVAKTGAAMLVGGALGGMVGMSIGRRLALRGADSKRADYAGRPLDDIVASDRANFAVPYDRLENVQLNRVRRRLILGMKLEGKRASFTLNRHQEEQARPLIAATIPGLVRIGKGRTAT